jgi:hypothetical protein
MRQVDCISHVDHCEIQARFVCHLLPEEKDLQTLAEIIIDAEARGNIPNERDEH